MKFLFACIFAALAVSALALTDEQKEKLKTFSTECEAKTEVTHEEVIKLKNEKAIPEGSDKEKIWHFCDCMLEKIKFRKADGSIDVELIKTKIPTAADKTKAVPHVEKCAGIQAGASTSCKIIKCLAEHKDQLVTTLPV